MSREEILMQLIRLKFRSLHNFSAQTNIPNSTLNSMFKKGLGGTSFDTVLKVCSALDCDIYSLTENNNNISAADRDFFSKYLSLSSSSKDLINVVASHQLDAEKAAKKITAQKSSNLISFPPEKSLSVKTIRVYLSAASAGLGDYLEDSDYEEIYAPDTLPSGADFGIKIHGDSMTPQIADGDVVWVHNQQSVDENQIGVFVLNSDALCKKLVRIGTQ